MSTSFIASWLITTKERNQNEIRTLSLPETEIENVEAREILIKHYKYVAVNVTSIDT